MSREFDYFVLLANMRTGSNLFEQNIRLYPEFACHGELFNPHFIGFPNVEEQFDVTLEDREHKPARLINRMVQSDQDVLSGFRLFSDHDERVLEHCLKDPRCAKIVLTRNPLDSFVSHAIARATDQWKLTDVSKRKKTQIKFEISAFRAYLKQLEDYLSRIKTALQTSGQTAFYLRYEDLNNVDVFNGLAQFLGGAEPMRELQVKIVRQNPESLAEKVSNFDQMMTEVRQIDLLDTQAVPLLEPVRNPGSKNFKAGGSLPILFLPMHRDDHPELAEWLRAHEQAISGSADISLEMTQKQLANWLTDHPNRQTIGIVTHPVERAYNAFYRHIFLSGDSLFPWIRTTLENHYGMALPDLKQCEEPNRTALEHNGYTAEKHRAAFLVFLTFLKGNLQGQTRSRVDQSWASQNAILQGYSRLVFADRLVRNDALGAALADLETHFGLEPVPLPRPTGEDHCFSLTEVYSQDVEKAARAAYARDYQMFGFEDWG